MGGCRRRWEEDGYGGWREDGGGRIRVGKVVVDGERCFYRKTERVRGTFHFPTGLAAGTVYGSFYPKVSLPPQNDQIPSGDGRPLLSGHKASRPSDA